MNADPIARFYRYAEYGTFGPLLWRARSHYLAHLQQARHILILGEGDGRFLAALCESNRQARIDIYDTSAEMLKLAQERTKAHHHRLHFHQQDILTAHLPLHRYDAVVANFVFDCFSDAELRRLLVRLGCAAQPGCLYYVSDFTSNNVITGALYLGFRLCTGLRNQRLPDIALALREAGKSRTQEQEHCFGLLTSQLWR